MHRILLLLSFAAALPAATVAVIPGSGIEATDSRAFTIGWEFSLSAPVTVSHLGFLDVGEDGLLESHDVGIFDTATTNLLVSATVPSGTGATLTSGFRWVSIAPFVLGVGTYRIGGTISGANEPWIFQASGTTAASPVTYLGGGYEIVGSGLNYPSIGPFNGEAHFGPNFQFDEEGVPEPSTLTLAAAGLIAAALVRRRLPR